MITQRKMPIGYYAGMAILLLRGMFYFLLRLRLPRRVVMDRGASIRGISNIEFRGWTKIGANALLDARYCDRVVLGPRFSLGDHSVMRCSGSPLFVCPSVTIGTDVSFGPYCNIGGGFGLVIGDENIFGPYVSIHPETHVVADLDRPIRQQGVTGKGIAIGADNWFGAKATVLDGSVIGTGNIVAAGAVVTPGDHGSRRILGGVPVRQLGERT
jgi:acetyltransferase-like isoleucine patch superfamily enzyme